MSRRWTTLAGVLSLVLSIICGTNAIQADASAPAFASVAYTQPLTTTTSDVHKTTGPYMAQCQKNFPLDGAIGFIASTKSWQSWRTKLDIRNCVDENVKGATEFQKIGLTNWIYDQLRGENSTTGRAHAVRMDTGEGLIFQIYKKKNPRTGKLETDYIDCPVQGD